MQLYLSEETERRLKIVPPSVMSHNILCSSKKRPGFFLKIFFPFPLSPGESCAIMSPSSE